MKKYLIGLVAAAMLAVTVPAEARYGGARSFSSTRVYSRPSYTPRPSYSVPSRPVYTAPRAPVYRAPPVVHSTTIVNKSGGGFFSNMFSTGVGVLGGMALFNWLSGNNNQQQQTAPAPQAPASAASAPQGATK